MTWVLALSLAPARSAVVPATSVSKLSSRRRLQAANQSHCKRRLNQPAPDTSYMTLPIAMDSHNRLFRFPKPQWLNSANTRTAGVYFAGALVCSSSMTPNR